MRILHLSDPQFGALCEARPVVSTDPSSIIRHPYVVSFYEYAGSRPRPELIALTGDITSSARPSEYLQAEAFIRALRGLWGPPEVQTVVVPGNHDVSWDIGQLEQDPAFNGLRFSPYKAFREVVCDAKIEILHPYSPQHCGEFVSYLETDSAQIIGINTATDEKHDQKPHHGAISDWQVSKVEELLADGTRRDFRLLLLHHHLQPLKDPPLWHDVSTAVNAAALVQLLENHEFSIAVHGHRHMPNLDHSGGNHCCHIFGAGAFSVVPTERGGGDIRNFAHWIELTGTLNSATIGIIESVKCIGSAGSYAWKAPSLDDFRHMLRLARPLARNEIHKRVASLEAGTVKIGLEILKDPELAATPPTLLRSTIAQIFGTHELTNEERDLADWKLFPK